MSTTFVTPVDPGAALTRVTPSAPIPDLRFQGAPVMWIGVPGGAAITAFATGAVARSQGASGGIPGDSASAWTLFQLSPLPQMNSSAFKLITGGLPVQLVLLPGTAGPVPASDDRLKAGDPLATAPAGGAFLAFAFQDGLCRDPLTAVEAIAASGACDTAWPQLITTLSELPGALNLRVLDYRGAPAVNGTVTVSVGGGPPATVALTAAMDGDTGVAVPAMAQATVTFADAADPVVAGGDDDTGAFQAALQLSGSKRMAQILDAATWLAAPEAGVAVQRWNPGSLVETIQEGNPYFAALVGDLRKAKPGAGQQAGKVQLAGWAFVKGSLSDSTIDWPLIPGDDSTTLMHLITDLRGAGVETRLLVNQFIRWDSATLDDFPELTPILFTVYASLSPLQVLLKIQTDPAGYVIGLIAVAALSAVLASSVTLDAIKSAAEYSTALMDALQAVDPTIATWTPYDAAFADNPLVPEPPKILLHTLDDVSHLGVYHQKYVTIRRADGSFVAYLGGIDINSDRPDTTIHRAEHPFHDVQVQISGPAVLDVIQSYEERAKHHNAPVAIPAASVGAIPVAGSHLVQIARTYFKPAPGSPTAPLPFAPNGETTPVRTIKNAIGLARDFIYIEDQYFTPPDDYVDALLAAADTCRGPLLITMPYQTDQPYGGVRRADVLNALQNRWAGRFYAGTPLRRYLHEVPALTTNLGRMRLANPLTAGGPTCDLSPLAHIPPPPFWAFVGNELMLLYAQQGGPSGSGATAFQTYQVSRATPGSWGAKPVAHPVGTPVLAVQIPGIYVHAKVMIVDDVFLFAGSSNINRRGLYHDGEMNSFTIPQHLKGDPANPARLLRCHLMAEHAGLSPEMGQSLFADPLSAVSYLTSRSWYQGAPWQPLSFYGSLPLDVSLGTSDTLGGWLLNILIGSLEQAAKPDVWPLLVDPTTTLDASTAKGPEYP